MSALTSVAPLPAFAASYAQTHWSSRGGDVVASYPDAARPSRMGGAPLSGALAVDAYRRTAAVDSSNILSRIDEHA